ncbi:MAG: UDP-N-acetylmuramoyl-tripeptide--D-alanyl-D-alanine ligase [Treponema sp.]|jgi:UDP-N-acetylmuramoyl-tripeptide--D-alanyl-D-alanine ligase|nr:UDP-N-acetylmuramoyl-tripeptide--D-alanyl-D-alanine ligase [Treponema sp.]
MDKSILMTFEELSEAVKGDLFYGTRDKTEGFSSVALDSRNVKPGGLFVALSGSVQDGHRFVEAGFNAGACAALVSRDRFADAGLNLAETARKTGKALVLVDDTLAALQDAAAAYLSQFPGLLRVGITGSAGKTTTKEIAAAMIGRERSVVMNPGNLNSETGLPLSVFNVRSFHEVGIFEMGMNRKGEIWELARVLKPRIALITNIGQAHIGILGSKEQIALEKAAIFSQFTGDETALVPARDEYAGILVGKGGKAVLYGEELFKELGAVRYRGLEGTDIVWEGKEVRFGLPGKHNFANAMAAAAIARQIPVSAEAVRAGLESVKPLFGRGEILSGPVTIVRDCYNANPDSVEEVLALCDGAEWRGRRIYVLGSMLELGEQSRAFHRELGRRLLSSKADMVFLYGRETRDAAEVLESENIPRGRLSPAAGGGFPYFYTDNMDVLRQNITRFVRPGDMVLLKGSRACALEQLTAILSAIGRSREKESDHDRAGFGGEQYAAHVLEAALGPGTEGRH